MTPQQRTKWHREIVYGMAGLYDFRIEEFKPAKFKIWLNERAVFYYNAATGKGSYNGKDPFIIPHIDLWLEKIFDPK